jgi:putative ABC transport system substrate-binding protein
LGLQDLGYVKDQNIILDYRPSGGNLERLPGLATELVGAKVDLIMASLVPNVEAARRATSTIPIVFVTVNDPVGRGYIVSFGRPGGNITGQANVNEETSGKRIERFASEGVGAVFTVQDGMFYNERERLAGLFLKHDMPAIATHREDAEAGILLAYGETVAGTFRSVATYVDKILKGTSPADLPVQRLTKWDLVVNLSTAQALGLTVPAPVLGQAQVVQ